MVVELVCVGTELLLGNIINTNAAFLAEECAKLGLFCYYQSVVGDNEERLTTTLKTAMDRADIVILSGGMGPTPDDLTKEVAANVCDRKMYLDSESKQAITTYFKKKNMEIPDNNWKQAMIPEGSVVLPNPNGTAPGVIIEVGEKRVVLLPGPPSELIPMFKDYVIPHLRDMMPNTIVSKTVKICGMSESAVAEKIDDLIKTQSNPTIATYAKTGEVQIRVTAQAGDIITAKKMIKPIVNELKKRFGAYIYSTHEETTLEKAVVDLLEANKLSIATVESCTGGLLAGRIINVPGVSEYFRTGAVTYSNKSKRILAGVKKSTLEKYGAVSQQTAEEMVKGIQKSSEADVVVSTTGIAGPEGGTDEKPVGLVYISCYVRGRITTKEYHFSGNRAKIREATVASALTLLRQCILEYFSETTFR